MAEKYWSLVIDLMMRQKGIKLSVPEPCHEKWSEMSQSEKGRFCMSCQKEVVDFTTYSDEQILNYFSNISGNQCGRFHPMQLDKKIVPVRTVERPSAIKLFLASLLVFLGLRESNAQEKKKSESLIQTTNDENLTPINPKNAVLPNPSVIRGLVIDSITDEPIIGVSIVVEGTGVGCSTDLDGQFSFSIPPKYVSDSTRIKISSIGYEPKYYLLSNGVPMKIELSVDHNMILGGPLIRTGGITVEPLEKRMETLRVKTWLRSIGHW